MPLYTWGAGRRCELGHGEVDRHGCCALPQRVPLDGVVFVACGEGCTAAVTGAGRLFTWGSGRKGRLGHGTERDEAVPRAILGPLSTLRVCRVSVGEAHLGCSTEDGRAFVWGNGAGCALGQGGTYARSFSAVPLPVVTADGAPLLDVQDIACAYRYTGVLIGGGDSGGGGGDLLTWGNNSFGQLGLGEEAAASQKPVAWPQRVGGLPVGEVVSFSLGSLFAGACDATGNLYMWGYGGSGNLGQGNRRSFGSPQRVAALAGTRIAAVHCTVGQINPVIQDERRFTPGCEGPHTVAVAEDGALYTFGTCNKGQLGNVRRKILCYDADELVPYRVGDPARDEAGGAGTGYLEGRRLSQALASSIHTAALDTEGTVWTMGCASDGRMAVDKFLTGLSGGRSRLKCYISAPTPVEELRRRGLRATMIATSRRHMACICEPAAP